MSERPLVGVFDSGFGGLTVLRELLQHLPHADFIYLGDTAHLPYGSKSQAMVTRYTEAAVRELVRRGAAMVVVACNTASALALPTLEADAAVPLVGVIGPGARAAAEAAPAGGSVLVLATEATVASHAYAEACAQAGLSAVEKACPLFVPLVEEGWVDGPVTEAVAQIYLDEALGQGLPDVVVLGCTHYPLLRPMLERKLGSLGKAIPVVDSAEATARTAAMMLPGNAVGELTLQFFATDSAAKFQRFAPRFLGRPVASVEQLQLDV